MTTTHLNVSRAADLSADSKAVGLASQADGGDGARYLIKLKAGATLTESANMSAISLAGSETLTVNRQGAAFNSGDAYRGLVANSGATTIENVTAGNALAEGGAGCPGA